MERKVEPLLVFDLEQERLQISQALTIVTWLKQKWRDCMHSSLGCDPLEKWEFLDDSGGWIISSTDETIFEDFEVLTDLQENRRKAIGALGVAES